MMSFDEIQKVAKAYITFNLVEEDLSEFETAVSQATTEETLRTICLDHFYQILSKLISELKIEQDKPRNSLVLLSDPCPDYTKYLDKQEKKEFIPEFLIKRLKVNINAMLSNLIVAEELVTNPGSRFTEFLPYADRHEICVLFLKSSLTLLQHSPQLNHIQADFFEKIQSQLTDDTTFYQAVREIVENLTSNADVTLHEVINNLLRSAYTLTAIIASNDTLVSEQDKMKFTVMTRLNHICSPAAYESRRVNKNIIDLNENIFNTKHNMNLHALLEATSKYILGNKQEFLNDSLNIQIKRYAALLKTLAKHVMTGLQNAEIDQVEYCFQFIKHHILPFRYHDDKNDDGILAIFQDHIEGAQTLADLLKALQQALTSFNESLDFESNIQIYLQLGEILVSARSLFTGLPHEAASELYEIALLIYQGMAVMRIQHLHDSGSVSSERIEANMLSLMSDIAACETFDSIPLFLNVAIQAIQKQCGQLSFDFNRKVGIYVSLLEELFELTSTIQLPPYLDGDMSTVREYLTACMDHTLVQKLVCYFDDPSLRAYLINYMDRIISKFESQRLTYYLRAIKEDFATKPLSKIIEKEQTYWLKTITECKAGTFRKRNLDAQCEIAYQDMESAFSLLASYLTITTQAQQSIDLAVTSTQPTNEGLQNT